LSSLWDVGVIPVADDEEGEGMTFLKKILDETNTRADPKAHIRPTKLDALISKEHANITPSVRGSNDI
jgi:hypothetical protein